MSNIPEGMERVLYFTLVCYFALLCVMLLCFILLCTLLYFVTLCHVTLHYVTLLYAVTLHYFTLCYFDFLDLLDITLLDLVLVDLTNNLSPPSHILHAGLRRHLLQASQCEHASGDWAVPAAAARETSNIGAQEKCCPLVTLVLLQTSVHWHIQ